jgi:hypothetical protein
MYFTAGTQKIDIVHILKSAIPLRKFKIFLNLYSSTVLYILLNNKVLDDF